jgi:hypothetical protein
MAQRRFATHSDWPAITSGYVDEFGRIDLATYRQAARLWPAAKLFAIRALGDPARGLSLLFKASAIVSRVAETKPDSIVNPGAYLMRTYKRLVSAEHATEDARERLTERWALGRDQDDSSQAVERHILISEMLNCVPSCDRSALELFARGYSFADMGRILRQNPETVRSKLRISLRRIRRAALTRTTHAAKSGSPARAAMKPRDRTLHSSANDRGH